LPHWRSGRSWRASRRPLARGGGTLLVLAAAAAASGCSSRGGDIPYNVQDFGRPDPRSWVDADYEARLGPLDLLRINVFRVPDLSGEYQVDHTGSVDLPLVGRVSVRDQTASDFAQTLEQTYGRRYLNDPEITVRLVSTPSNNITVEGGVNGPGVIELNGPTTLLGAIAKAGGIQPNNGNPRRVVVFRKRGGQTVAAAFDVVDIRRGKMADPMIYPGDTVVVDSSDLKALYRELLQVVPTLAIFSSL
jgi:polysaccharide biosynthesis/export protein